MKAEFGLLVFILSPPLLYPTIASILFESTFFSNFHFLSRVLYCL